MQYSLNKNTLIGLIVSNFHLQCDTSFTVMHVWNAKPKNGLVMPAMPAFYLLIIVSTGLKYGFEKDLGLTPKKSKIKY